VKAPALFAATLLLAGCSSRPFRGEEGAPRAVVFSLPAQDRQSEILARALHDLGYDVLRKSTPIVRPKTSVAVYDVKGRPERVREVSKLVEDLGMRPDEVVLPFQQHATGGNIVVAWLGEDAAFD
jgi:hypothetical protein